MSSRQAAELDREAILRRENAWQNAILDSADFTIISTDLQGLILTCNAGALNKLGYLAEEVIGKVTPVIIHDRDEVVRRAQALSEELGHDIEPGFEAFVAKARLGTPDENDWTYICKDGSRFLVRLSVTALRDESGEITGFLGIGKDVTQQREAERALIESEARFHAFMDNTPVVAYIKDQDGRFVYVNKPLLERFEKRLEDIIGTSEVDHWPPEIIDPVREHDKLILQNDEPVTLEEKVPTPDGLVTTWLSFKFPLRDTQGQKFLAGMSIDISDRKYYEYQLEDYQRRLEMAITELERISSTDALTQLHNKGAFTLRLVEEIERAKRYKLPLSVMLMDIDNFKLFNDSFGHPAGDEVIRQVAQLMQSHARPSDYVARIGGEEYAIILSSTPAQGAFIVAERLRRGIESAIWTKRRITVSIGVAELGDARVDSASLMQAADQALYRAKDHGRNQVKQA